MIELVADFKDRLRYAMTYRKMRQVDIVEKTGIPKASISQYLGGYTKPNSERLNDIAKALSVNPVWLMGLDVPMEVDLESELVRSFRKLSERDQKIVLNMVNSMLPQD